MEKEYHIHISDMRTFKACRQKWSFASPLRMNLTYPAPQRHLWLGSIVHDCLEAYYHPGLERDPQILLDVYEELVEESYVEFDKMKLAPKQLDELDKFSELGYRMLVHYGEWASVHDDFKVLASEISLKVPIPFIPGKKVYYVGRTDGHIWYRDDYWLMEHKTATRLPDMTTLFLDEQCIAYQWGCTIDPTFRGKEPVGTLYNFLLKKVPAPPQVLKGGGLSRNKAQSTTEALYRAALAKHNLEVGPYLDFLNHLKGQETQYFYRTHIQRTPAAMHTFGTRFIATIVEMLDPLVVIYPSPSWFSCQYCAFREPCTLVANGLDPGPLLEYCYVKREPHHSRLQEKEKENGTKST